MDSVYLKRCFVAVTQSLSLACYSVLVSSCLSNSAKTTENSSAFKNISSRGLPEKLVCPEGLMPQWFALGLADWKILQFDPVTRRSTDVSRDVYPPFFNINRIEAWDPTSVHSYIRENNYKFEFCSSRQGDLSLKRIVHGTADSHHNVIAVDESAVLTGFSELVFGTTAGLGLDIPFGNGEVLRAREFVPARPEANVAYIMVGVGTKDGHGLVVPTDNIVTVGQVQMQVDPYGKCAEFNMSGVFNQQTLLLGTAKIEASLCVDDGGGDSLSYKVAELTITDSHPSLGTQANIPVNFTGVAVSSAWKENLTHHTTCDSFVFKSGLATYAATAAPWDGSDSTIDCNRVPGAPILTDSATKAEYAIKYRNGEKVTGVLERRHYFDETGLRSAFQ
jgi:hypothetical protein